MPSRITIKGRMSEERRKQPFIAKFTASAVTVSIFLTGILLGYINSIDAKLFAHLTNSDMHVIRTQVVSRGEWEIVNEMRRQDFSLIQQQLNEIKIDLRSKQ